MAFLEIEGILNGRRLRRCSPTAHWRYGYYLLLTNGYGRIEMDFEYISYRLVSFRGTAPSPQDIEAEFAEYAANHLIFVYEHNGRKWAQFDTPNSGSKEWKTAVDLKSPMPPEQEYCAWLTVQHGDQWKKFHWFNPAHKVSHKTKGLRQEPDWALPSLIKCSADSRSTLDQDLAKSSPILDQGSALGLGLVSGLGINTKAGSKPSARRARVDKPQPAKVSNATAETKHKRIEHMLQTAWEDHNPGAGKCPWGGDDGAQLKRILEKTANWPDTSYAQCIANLYATEGFPRSELPVFFLPRLPTYFQGPKDRYNRELGASNGNGTNKSVGANRDANNVEALVRSGLGAGVQRVHVDSGPAVQNRANDPDRK